MKFLDSGDLGFRIRRVDRECQTKHRFDRLNPQLDFTISPANFEAAEPRALTILLIVTRARLAYRVPEGLPALESH